MGATSWNPVTGCNKISPGCKFCYAERLAKRLQLMGNPRYSNGFKVTLHADQITLPLRWRDPRMIFVNSMSDLFHDEVPLPFIDQLFDVMARASHHTFQVLTKRADRLVLWHRGGAVVRPIPENVWIGVSVESSRYAWRVDRLRQVEAGTRFVSAEPLLGPLSNVNLSGISWLITGGESGGSRQRSLVEHVDGAWRPKPKAVEWIREIRDRCLEAGVAFFHKQWGGPTPKAGGRILDGQECSAYPVAVPMMNAHAP
jgi:protein gp37